MIDKDAYRRIFEPKPIPADLIDLVEFQNDSAEFYSEGFEIVCDDGIGILSTYSNDEDFQNRFTVFAKADSTGSNYAFWAKGKDSSLEKCPVVVFGSEGGVRVVARDLRELLQLLSMDTEPMINWTSVVFYKGTDGQVSKRHSEFIEWLKIRNIDAISDTEAILTRAQSDFQSELDGLIKSVMEGP